MDFVDVRLDLTRKRRLSSPTFIPLNCLFQTSDDPKLRGIYEGAILHDVADDRLLNMIRDKQHVYIEWKTNLQWLMKQDFLKTNSCDFSLGITLLDN